MDLNTRSEGSDEYHPQKGATVSTNKTTARIAGILFIIATAASLLSLTFLGPLDAPDYLTKVSENVGRVGVGVLLLFIAAFTSAAIALSLYPVLRRHREGLAIGAVGFRVIEGVLYTIGAVSVLLLLTLSQDFVKAAPADSSNFETLGTLLKALRDWAGLAGVFAFYSGAMMYYFIFYKSRLVPRWLSGWGVVGGHPGPGCCRVGSIRCRRLHVDHPSRPERPDRGERDRPGCVAHRQGVQSKAGPLSVGRPA